MENVNTGAGIICGEKGFLGAHQRKTFGIFMVVLLKGQRTDDNRRNFSGRFEDRMWYRVDHEFGAQHARCNMPETHRRYTRLRFVPIQLL